MGRQENKRLQRLSPESTLCFSRIRCDSAVLRRAVLQNQEHQHGCQEETWTLMPPTLWQPMMAPVAGMLVSSGLPISRSPHRYRWIERGLGSLDARPVVSPRAERCGIVCPAQGACTGSARLNWPGRSSPAVLTLVECVSRLHDDTAKRLSRLCEFVGCGGFGQGERSVDDGPDAPSGDGLQQVVHT